MRANLVEVDAENFEDDADVVAERERVEHVDDVVPVVGVLFPQLIEDADLLARLTMKPLLVANDLERHLDVVLVVLGLDHLAETAAPETLYTTTRYDALCLRACALTLLVGSFDP